MAQQPYIAPPANSLAERLQNTCLGLLAIASVTGEEAALADNLWQWAEQLGLWPAEQCKRVGNAMVLGTPDHKRPCIALVGHLDTVPPPTGTFALPSLEQHDGQRRIVGLGASDMKASIAVMQLLLQDLPLAELPFCPILVFYDREEGPFADNGLEPLLADSSELRDVDLAIVMEPTDNALELGCMGGLQATVRFVGQAAHSARPWQGVNAIHRAGPLLSALLVRQHEEVVVDGLTFRNAISATLAQGGRARNVVPDSFELNINYRFAPTPNATELAQAELARLAEGAEIHVTDISPPGPVPQGNPILGHWMALAQPTIRPKQAWTDVARLATYGIDAINFGPGSGAQAHQAGEWVCLENMLDSYEMLSKLLTTPLS